MPFIFANPGFLFLLLAVPVAIAWYWFKYRHQHAKLIVSSLAPFGHVRGWKPSTMHILFGFRMVAVSLLVIALARPQTNMSKQEVNVEGIDIILATDISGSMLAEDFKPNRLEAAKDVAEKFINSRPNDRMGLVVFSGESFTQCPLTTDHSVLINLFNDIKSGMIDDGTALGDGLATAVNRLKNSKSKSKVIILLTDGVNNMGSVDPQSAAQMAAIYGIRIYTIGVGANGYAPYPFQTPFGIEYQQVEVKIDEALLKKISALSNGAYYRATNKDKLVDIYKSIDAMEKSKITVTEFARKKEGFMPFVILALLFFTLELFLRTFVFRTIP
jgi:Ca-activated chloride channel homolog